MTAIHTDPDTSAITEKPPLIKWGWVRALLFFAGGFPVMFVVRELKRFFIYDNPDIVGSEAMFYGQVIKASGFILLIFLLRKLIDRRSFESLGFDFSSLYRRDMMIGIGAGIGMVALIFATLLLSGSISVTSVQFPVIDLLWLFGVMGVVALREEIVSRGYMLVSLLASMPKYWALLATSLVFALLHVDSPTITVFSFINIILAGLLMGVYYIHRRNLWFPIGLHFGWNFAIGPIFGSAISGNVVASMLSLELTGSEWMTGGGFGFEGSILAPIAFIAATVLIHLKYRNAAVTPG
jgi:hypothetical protein